MDAVGPILVALVVVGIYLWLANLVSNAAKRKGRSAISWFVIAIVFGIVIPAIIVAIMAPARTAEDFDDDYVSCPSCAEDVRPEAVKCRHCGETLTPVQ